MYYARFLHNTLVMLYDLATEIYQLLLLHKPARMMSVACMPKFAFICLRLSQHPPPMTRYTKLGRKKHVKADDQFTVTPLAPKKQQEGDDNKPANNSRAPNDRRLKRKHNSGKSL